MGQSDTTLVGPHKAYSVSHDLDPDGPCLTAIDRNHTPHNKRHGQVKSRAELEVMAFPQWVQFQIDEATEHPNGRVQRRTISVTLTRENAERIALHILRPRAK